MMGLFGGNEEIRQMQNEIDHMQRTVRDLYAYCEKLTKDVNAYAQQQNEKLAKQESSLIMMRVDMNKLQGETK